MQSEKHRRSYRCYRFIKSDELRVGNYLITYPNLLLYILHKTRYSLIILIDDQSSL